MFLEEIHLQCLAYLVGCSTLLWMFCVLAGVAPLRFVCCRANRTCSRGSGSVREKQSLSILGYTHYGGVCVCCSRDEKKAFHFEGALTLRLIGRISGIQEDSFDNFLKHTPLTRSHEQGSHSLLCARYCSSNVLLLLYHRTFGSANLCSCCTQNDRGLVSIQNLCVAFTCGCPKALPRTASYTH